MRGGTDPKKAGSAARRSTQKKATPAAREVGQTQTDPTQKKKKKTDLKGPTPSEGWDRPKKKPDLPPEGLPKKKPPLLPEGPPKKKPPLLPEGPRRVRFVAKCHTTRSARVASGQMYMNALVTAIPWNLWLFYCTFSNNSRSKREEQIEIQEDESQWIEAQRPLSAPTIPRFDTIVCCGFPRSMMWTALNTDPFNGKQGTCDITRRSYICSCSHGAEDEHSMSAWILA